MEKEKELNISKNDNGGNGVVLIDKLKYHGFCASCNNDWDQETRPTKCPNCGHTGIVISENN